MGNEEEYGPQDFSIRFISLSTDEYLEIKPDGHLVCFNKNKAIIRLDKSLSKEQFDLIKKIIQ